MRCVFIVCSLCSSFVRRFFVVGSVCFRRLVVVCSQCARRVCEGCAKGVRSLWCVRRVFVVCLQCVRRVFVDSSSSFGDQFALCSWSVCSLSVLC